MTMEANKLMVDDWVLWKGKPVQVASASGIKYSFGHIVTLAHCNEEKILETHYIKSIQPIPLTPEILEKNGFHINGIPSSITSVKGIDDWSDDTYVWSRQETPDERMFVSVYMDDPANFFIEVYCQYCHADGIHVKYLHELQHALKLCKIDKDIVL